MSKARLVALAYIIAWAALTWYSLQEPSLVSAISMGHAEFVFPLQILGVLLLFVSVRTLIWGN